jgi:hypothetical protein
MEGPSRQPVVRLRVRFSGGALLVPRAPGSPLEGSVAVSLEGRGGRLRPRS